MLLVLLSQIHMTRFDHISFRNLSFEHKYYNNKFNINIRKLKTLHFSFIIRSFANHPRAIQY